MSKIKYLAHYTEDLSKRPSSPAACNKMAYIIKALSETIGNVEIISACNTILYSQKGSRTLLDNNSFITYLPSLYRGNKIAKLFSILFFNVVLFFYLLFTLKKGDVFIVYHGLSLMRITAFLKKIKKVKLILEVEEIYGDVTGSQKTVEKELKFFKLADGYIFPTKLLDKKINCDKKPSVIIHGTYESTPIYEKQFDDDKIHIVYAGTLDPRKGGAIAAAAAGEFLDSNYHMHILGFGSEEEKSYIFEEIEKVSKKSDCKVTYDGCLSGDEYLRFLQSCDIGLSTQNPNAAFNDTSFPSKILSYMSNGLRVVSVRIPAIETSAVGNYIYYYSEQKPEEIAKIIKNINLAKVYDGKQIINELDNKFKTNVYKVITDVNGKRNNTDL